MAHDILTLRLKIPSALHYKLSLYADLKNKSLAEAAHEALTDWLDTIGTARLECAIDREITAIAITALLDGTPAAQILPPDERVIN
jgi:hypothetical protein